MARVPLRAPAIKAHGLTILGRASPLRGEDDGRVFEQKMPIFTRRGCQSHVKSPRESLKFSEHQRGTT
jgi:hypothetical protein